MALVALMALMLGSFAGLLIGRWAAVLPLAAADPCRRTAWAARSWARWARSPRWACSPACTCTAWWRSSTSCASGRRCGRAGPA